MGTASHAAVCAGTGLPLAWRIASAREHESLSVSALLDTISARGFQPATTALDIGYDVRPVYDACHARGILPVIPLRKTIAVKRGEHGSDLQARPLDVRRFRLQAQRRKVALPRQANATPSPVGSKPSAAIP